MRLILRLCITCLSDSRGGNNVIELCAENNVTRAEISTVNVISLQLYFVFSYNFKLLLPFSLKTGNSFKQNEQKHILNSFEALSNLISVIECKKSVNV